MRKKTVHFFVILVCSVLIVSYGCKQKQKDFKTKPEHTFTVKGSVREISITPETPDFPKHDGVGEFTSYCSMCHSLKYISMQPDLPRKTWEAEVNKMITKYKAPIDSVTANKIVDYLAVMRTKV
jgi:hypothetical protein